MALAVVPAAVIGGTRAGAVERARELGTDLIQVGADPGGSSPVEESDLEPLRRGLEEEFGAGAGNRLSALRVARARLDSSESAGNPTEVGVPAEVWLLGTDELLLEARGKAVLQGRFPRPSQGPAIEAALEEHLAAQLGWVTSASGSPRFDLDAETLYLRFGDARPVVTRSGGDGAIPLRIVGVVEDDRGGNDPFGNRKDTTFTDLVGTLLRAIGVAPAAAPWRDGGLGIYLPREHIEGERLDWLFLRVDPILVGDVAVRAEKVLVDRGRTPLIYMNAVWPILTSPELEGYLVIHDVFFVLFVCIGLIVLANLLLLSGWQRRREIALRRAEGATRADIFVQFLWEGVFLALLGVVLGFLVGIVIAEIRVALDPNVVVDVSWPWWDGFRAALVLTCGALVAAAYPAWRASGHHPMTLFRRT